MGSQSSNTVSVNVGALSTAIAVAIQQATQLEPQVPVPLQMLPRRLRAERRYFYIATHACMVTYADVVVRCTVVLL